MEEIRAKGHELHGEVPERQMVVVRGEKVHPLPRWRLDPVLKARLLKGWGSHWEPVGCSGLGSTVGPAKHWMFS